MPPKKGKGKKKHDTDDEESEDAYEPKATKKIQK